MPRGKKKQAEAEAQDAANPTDAFATGGADDGQSGGPRLNKMACVRKALRRLGDGARPKDIQDFLKRRFDLDMDTKMISTYKGSILNKERAAQSALMRSPAVMEEEPPREEPPSGGGNIAVEEIRAVKELGDKLGAEKVRAIMDALYE